MVVDKVSNVKLEHILKDTRVFLLNDTDEYGEKTFLQGCPLVVTHKIEE